MAGSAVLVPWIGHVVRRRLRDDPVALTPEIARAVVAFEAQGKGNRSFQKTSIHRAMRAMTGLATVNPHAGVFEDKRAALVDVAFQAGFFVTKMLRDEAWPLSHSPGWRVSAVRIVAVRTLHHALIHSMLERHRKLSSYLAVTIAAKVDLLFGEQELRGRGLVDAMATGTNHVGLCVLRPSDVSPGNRLRVTVKAAVHCLSGSLLGESEDFRLVTAALNVRLARPVTAFATRCLSLVMRVAEEVPVYVWMTGAAGIAANKPLGIRHYPLR